MDDGDRHITSRELEDFKSFIDERFKAQRAQFLLAIGVAVGLIRFDLPDTVTVGALALIIGKSLWAVVGPKLI